MSRSETPSRQHAALTKLRPVRRLDPPHEYCTASGWAARRLRRHLNGTPAAERGTVPAAGNLALIRVWWQKRIFEDPTVEVSFAVFRLMLGKVKACLLEPYFWWTFWTTFTGGGGGGRFGGSWHLKNYVKGLFWRRKHHSILLIANFVIRYKHKK